MRGVEKKQQSRGKEKKNPTRSVGQDVTKKEHESEPERGFQV